METMRIDKASGYLVIHAPLEISLDCSTSTKQIVDDIFSEYGVSDVIFNLSHLKGINSCGIGFMVSLHTRCVTHGKRLYLYKPGPQAMKTLQLVQLNTFFSIAKELEQIPGAPDVEALYRQVNDDTGRP
jgi:anti-sigma B factor antagonist